MGRGTKAGTALALLGLIAPGAALAAPAKPGAATGAAQAVGAQGARLTGRVDPNQSPTTYVFQYGTSTRYGAKTPLPDGSAGAGASPRNVSAATAALAPATLYHYRLVARNAKGATAGADRTFSTQPQPLGVTLAANPNPIPAGGGTTLSGTLSGTGNGGRQVVLQDNPFPYTRGFANLGNAQVTDANGNFAFTLLSVPVTTQYKVLMPQKSSVVSPIVIAGVAVRVSTHVSHTHIHRGSRVRFSGTIRPARDGVQVAFQKHRDGRWITIGGTVARHAGSSFSRYARSVKINRGGTYRVFAGVEGEFVSGTGRSVHITTQR